MRTYSSGTLRHGLIQLNFPSGSSSDFSLRLVSGIQQLLVNWLTLHVEWVDMFEVGIHALPCLCRSRRSRGRRLRQFQLESRLLPKQKCPWARRIGILPATTFSLALWFNSFSPRIFLFQFISSGKSTMTTCAADSPS